MRLVGLDKVKLVVSQKHFLLIEWLQIIIMLVGQGLKEGRLSVRVVEPLSLPLVRLGGQVGERFVELGVGFELGRKELGCAELQRTGKGPRLQ